MTKADSVEQVETQGGTPEGSPEALDLVDSVFGTDESVPDGESAVQSDPETVETTEEIADSEDVDLHPEVQKRLAALDKKMAGMDKWFTEQTERNKRLREEAGLDKLDKDDKAARAEAKKTGVDIPKEYIARDYSSIITDEVLDNAVKKGVIHESARPVLKNVMPVLNFLMNDLRSESQAAIREQVEAIRNDLTPISERIKSSDLNMARSQKWAPVLQKFRETYKPSREQVEVLSQEVLKSWDKFDGAEPAEIEAHLRRIRHDPETIKKTTVKPVKATPEKKSATTEQKTQTGKKGDIYDLMNL